MLVLTVLTPRDVARKGHTRQVITPKERQFPTILPGPKEPGGPCVSPVVFHGEPAHPVYVCGVFLSTHLHDPCLCRRGHDLSNKDNIVWLWLLGIHG